MSNIFRQTKHFVMPWASEKWQNIIFASFVSFRSHENGPKLAQTRTFEDEREREREIKFLIIDKQDRNGCC